MKIKSILVSQPDPQNPKSPYYELSRKHNLKVDFRSFIEVVGVPCKEFRLQKISILDFTAVVFTSKTAIDHFFRICEEMRITVPDSMKYFCITENIAFYLQKYIVYRKRKIFHGKAKFQELLTLINKHKEDRYFVPLSIPHKTEIPELLSANNINYKIGNLYKTISSDLSDLADVYYDILVFYSPSGPKSLLENFPDFKQNNTMIAAFGSTTADSIKEMGLRLDIDAPSVHAPSMTMALERYIIKANKR